MWMALSDFGRRLGTIPQPDPRHGKSGLLSATPTKTLKTPYDCGFVCAGTGSAWSAPCRPRLYIQYSEHRDGMLYTRRCPGGKKHRALGDAEILGKDGVEELVEGFAKMAVILPESCPTTDLPVMNDVVFNQNPDPLRHTGKTAACSKNPGAPANAGAAGVGDLARRSGDPHQRHSWQTTKEDIDD
jgi:hypothetical protein